MRHEWTRGSVSIACALALFVTVGLIGQSIPDFSVLTPLVVAWWVLYALIFVALFSATQSFTRIWSDFSGSRVLAVVTGSSAWVAVSAFLLLSVLAADPFGSWLDAGFEWGYLSVTGITVTASMLSFVTFAGTWMWKLAGMKLEK